MMSRPDGRGEAPRYARDMRGHGQTPPAAEWPGGARIAIQIVINYEEGGENSILHGDAASEAFLSEIAGAQPWPGQRHWNMESIYEYGARAGFWRLHRLLADVPVTVYGVATALARSPEQVAAMQDAGWEIASHGLKWIEYKDFSPEAEAAHMAEAIRLHTEVTGERPRGWYTGRCSDQTVRLAAEEGGFDYLADSYADELPYWLRVGGRDQLVVPYTLDANDMRFSAGTLSTGDDFETYLRDSFDCLYAEGEAGTPRMMSVGLHCRLAGRPGRVMGLKRFLDHARSHDGVWFATRAEIAAHWARHHPPRRIERPSRMDRAAFVAAFGGIVEHSPWVAERAFELELGPAHDSAAGLASALVRTFRSGSDAERLAILRKHPDLAGKLAAAKRLSQESASEQAGAGLDALTDAERAEFTELNDAYQTRHGFPFIIAVRDHDKAGILTAFRQRLDHDGETERAEAERQVARIVRLRLDGLLP
ncbi:chitin deacetylase [Palleronia aestuarii]|uniref:Chitooligosaccharide deacetylase n=1 Tax=Palleronia aestuarii TaxID=568105 RepID=A0A2W7MXJ6_9RHOB|nr:allantoinase PuuE [Palleronia aestuarii]PZX12253.1 chitin deacetylase [Palleronia aestuarii]